MPKSRTPVESNSNADPARLQYFEGLAWAVPTAFASALAAYRFEQGDVLFKDARAYESITRKADLSVSAIQVLHPPRSARAIPTEGEADRRRSSWQSEVRLELLDLVSGAAEPHSVTQGRLMMMLWRGDESWLDPEREEPDLPLGSRELGQRLDQACQAFDEKARTRKGSRFIFVVDLANDASRVKALAIEEALSTLGDFEAIDLFPAEAGVESPQQFHPALILRGIVVPKATPAQVEGALRGALYGGKADAGNRDTETATTDRFSAARHGRLDALGA